jgi:RNA polymerase sigma-70 factor (ECF subfamily)
MQENTYNETALIKQAQNNPADFAPLYDRYYKPIFVFIFKRIRQRELTADLTSQVFLKALVHIKRYEFRDIPFSSWLFRIAMNEVNMNFRNIKKTFHVPVSEKEVKSIIDETQLEDTFQNKQQVVEVLNTLDTNSSQLIELRFFDEYSFKEIGEITGMSADNAKIKTYRILEKLKKMISLK